MIKVMDIGKYPIITRQFRNEYGYSCQFKVTLQEFSVYADQKSMDYVARFYCPEVKKYLACKVRAMVLSHVEIRHLKRQFITILYNAVRYQEI